MGQLKDIEEVIHLNHKALELNLYPVLINFLYSTTLLALFQIDFRIWVDSKMSKSLLHHEALTLDAIPLPNLYQINFNSWVSSKMSKRPPF
jgi:hypothetical protein